MDAPEISVVVLAYRSAGTIASFVDSLVDSLEKEKLHWEIVLVGNYFEGIGDQTPKVVKEIAARDSRIKPVVEVKKGMMGWDMKTGLQAATGKALAVIDGDGQMPSTDVIRVYQLMKRDSLDLAKTYRAKRNDGSYRRLISVVYNILFKILFPGINAWDMNSKPKIMKKEFYEKINLESNGWFIDAEIMILARRMNVKIGEIETVFHSMDSRPSFVKPLSIIEFLGNLISYRIKEFLAKN
ncbi:MAG: glycosyltransferase family 2 protein [Nitrospina sp.]|jgi:glycosyltransferase involved in cell wall biosynthesis|nr:glycosyltransferase family 2 protein [Nitrospina sp.]MBT6717893.1 glycosyltransferase family 2 protein [Nitrospina sp.]